MASGESFDQMLRRVEAKRAGAAAEGAMAMPGKPFGKKDDSGDKGLAPGRDALGPTFGKKGSGSKKGFGKKGFAPASRGLRTGGR
jgi:hypothetical protein